MGINPYAQYQKTQIETADHGKLLLMLYDGALRFLGRAGKALEDKDMEKASQNLLRVQDIVAELMASLDLDSGEIAVSLFRLYEYLYYLLVQANMKKEAELLPQVENMLLELRNTWQQVVGAGQPAATPAGATPSAEAAIKPSSGYSQAARDEEGAQKAYKKVNISG